PGFGRGPYVHITLPDGRVLEGRASAWTKNKVLATFVDPEKPPQIVAGVTVHRQSVWMDAEHIERIPRRDATKKNPYDDTDWFQQQRELQTAYNRDAISSYAITSTSTMSSLPDLISLSVGGAGKEPKDCSAILAARK